MTPLSIFRDLALRKRDSKSLCFTSMCSIGCILTFKNDMGVGSLFINGFSDKKLIRLGCHFRMTESLSVNWFLCP